MNKSKAIRNASLVLASMTTGLAVAYYGLSSGGMALAEQSAAAPPPQPVHQSPAKIVAPVKVADCGASDAAASSAFDTRYDPARLGRGDRLKLAFYEILPSQDDKWGTDHEKLQQPARAIQLRPELSSDYLVQDNGVISIPMLGQFNAAGRKTVDLQRHLECAFDAFLGRKGFVNVLGVVNPPIYVVGKVKNTGSYDYAPGMTVLHAIALAGGLDKATMEPWQAAELTRQVEAMQDALDRATRMIARSAAIEAARDPGKPAVPVELADLAGKEKAQALVNEETTPLRLQMQALVADESSLKGAVESAAADLNMHKVRLPSLNQSLALRRERVANLAKLSATGVLGRPVLIQAQSDLLDAEDRAQASQSAINVAQDRLNKARHDLQVRQEQEAISLQKELALTRADAAKAAGEGDSAGNVLKAMARTQLLSPATLETEYSIVRRTATGIVEISATGTTLLQPGDLVQTRSGPPAMSAAR